MANIPNSRSYRANGSGNADAAASSPRPVQASQYTRRANTRAEPNAHQRQVRRAGESGTTIWPWVLGFAFVLFIFPIPTLLVVAILIGLAVLLGKR